MIETITEFVSDPYVLIVILTLMPFLELRASIPYGILVAKLPWWQVFVLAVIVNIALGPVIYFLIDKFLHLMLRIGFVKRIWDRMIVKTQKKIHPKVERYGLVGLGIFIGVPLPGSGVYSGAIGGYLLGFRKRDFYLATVIGVLIAAIVVAAVSIAGGATLQRWFIKT